MKKFNIIVPVNDAIGNQFFECSAESKEEALKKWEEGECEFVGEEIEIQSLGTPSIHEKDEN